MNVLRHESRIAIERTGWLTHYGQTTACRVTDFTEHGVRLHTECLSPPVGELLSLKCALDGHEDIECRLAVTHVHESTVGACIIDISKDHEERLSRFIENVITVNLNGTVGTPHRPAQTSSPTTAAPVSHLVPLLCLFGVIALVSAITPAIKYTLQHHAVDFLQVAASRIVIGFLVLAGFTLWFDPKGIWALTARDLRKLTVLGLLGVGGYPIAAWGLVYSSVTHFAIIYSLLPTFTTLLSIARGKDHPGTATMVGLLVSWAGCLVVLAGPSGPGMAWGVGDALILLFTLMMSCYLVLSPGIIKRVGVWTANTTMFGMISIVMLSGEAARNTVSSASLSPIVIGLFLFIGTATAGVFLLRSRALQSLSPAVVGAYHNLIPIGTIGLAALWLNETVTVSTLMGALAVVGGTELVRRAPVWRPRHGQPWYLPKPASSGLPGRPIVDLEAAHVPDVPARVA
jgi:drug/metabolite transporter (DMT)-like permease